MRDGGDVMRGAILSLFAVCLAAALLDLLAPGDRDRGLRRGLHLLTALAVLLLLLQPFLFLVREAPEQIGQMTENDGERGGYEAVFDRTLTAAAAGELRAGLYRLLAADYGIEEAQARIVLSFDGEGALTRVQIFLSGTALLNDPDALARDLGEKLGCSVEVR